MRTIIMFMGGVETQEFFSVEMAKTFEKENFFIYWYDLALQRESAKQLKCYFEAHKTDEIYAFTFNFNGIAGEDGLYKDGKNFWDEAGIPVLNMVVDHPLYYQKYRDTIPENYIQISIDENHEKYLKRFYPELSTRFLPLGGTELNAGHGILKNQNYLKIQERPIDIIFTGNYTPPQILRKHLCEMDNEYRNFYEKILDEVKMNPNLLVEEVAERNLLELFDSLTDAQLRNCMPNMMYVDLSVRFYYRGLLIAALADAGIQVHIFGSGWERLQCRHPENLILAGGVDSQKCLEKISQSKISLNVMPWFKAGAHDRIFNSVLNGAVCFSDWSSYVNHVFTDGKNIVLFSLERLIDSPQTVADQVKRLLEDPEQMQEIADAGYAQCVYVHGWNERAKEIINIIDEIRKNSLR